MSYKKIIFYIILVHMFLVCSVFAESKQAKDYRLQGYKFQKKGDLDKAIMYYKKACKADSKYACPYNDLGIIYEEKGYYSDAEKAYLKAIKVDAKYAPVYTNLAYFYENKGEVDKAIFYWKKRMSLSKNDSNWIKQGKEKIEELERRKQVTQEDVELRNKKETGLYKNKKGRKRVYKDWEFNNFADKKDNLNKELSNQYFEKGLEYFKKRQYDKSIGAFKLAGSYDDRNKEASRYLVKAQRVKDAIESKGIGPWDAEYAGVISKDDLMLARDNFKIGLDYYSQRDYKRAFSSFSVAMTYNPYDEVIRKYANDAKIKIEEQKLKKVKMNESKIRKRFQAREPRDLRKEMIKDKKDILNKGYFSTTEDTSVEGFIEDGKELFKDKRYEDAVYVWQQALLLDVTGVYKDDLNSLINEARNKMMEKEDENLDEIVESVANEELTKITRAAIPSTEGSSDWTFKRRKGISRFMTEVSKDKKAVIKKLNSRYTLSFQDATLSGVVDLLTELTGLNIVIDGKAIAKDQMQEANITFKVKDMPLAEIIRSVLRFTDFDYLIEDNMIWITTKEKIKKEDIKIVVYDVQDVVGKLFDFPAGELEAARLGSTGK
jgi:tetratricopeptide (TPR) repeat protein